MTRVDHNSPDVLYREHAPRSSSQQQERIRRTCVRCTRTFHWTPQHPNDQVPEYCKKSCREAARKDRKAERESGEGSGWVGLCPTPTKVKHSWISAGHAIDNVDSSMVAYRCNCGNIHIGHTKWTIH